MPVHVAVQRSRRGGTMPALRALLAAAACLGAATAAHAQPAATPPSSPPSPSTIDAALPGEPAASAAPAAIDVTVDSDLPDGDAASRVHYGRRELELRPRLRPGDIVEAVPGVLAVQHAGGGKANQYFIRGFDADHGTDVRISVDGVPVNMVSHAHGQGFADLHFLIPEVVVGLDGSKGPYYAALGDFATAGSVDLHLAEKLEESFAQVSAGQYGIYRALVVESPDLGADWRAVAAAEVFHDDGPFENPEKLWRFNLYAKVTHDFASQVKAWLSWMSYGSSWHGSGQIPARAVCDEGEADAAAPETFGAPCIDRFGSVDPSEGGATQRHAAQLGLTGTWDGYRVALMAYLVRYRFELFSNFTFFADDAANGDGIEQGDDRLFGGIDARLEKDFVLGGARFRSALGLQARIDGIENALYHVAARQRLDTKVHANVAESAIGAYFEEDARLAPYLRFVLGLRADRFDANVDDLRTGPEANASGIADATLLSPKAIAVVTPIPELELFLDYGRGFHSNDARGAVAGATPVTLLTPATGYEVGMRAKPVEGLSLEAAGFLIDLDSEIVWSGDAGGTEPSGATRRYGVELGARYAYSNWLFADLETTVVKPSYRGNAGNGEAVALAPTFTLSASVGVRPSLDDFTPFASLRLKAITDRPANEDQTLTADGFAILDANAGLRWKDVEAAVDIQNLLNSRWREVNFATDSRLAFEPAVVSGIHYTPGWPFTAIGRLCVYWR